MNEDRSFHVDLHVHTARHSECAESLDPFKLGVFASQSNINCVVITEHDTLWNPDEFTSLKNHTRDILLFNGIEVTTKHGYHLVVVGIEDCGPLKKGVTCDDAISYAHEKDAAVILAHPFMNGLPPVRIVESIDAIEIGSTSLYTTEAKLSRHLAQVLNKPCIASSDAHALSMVGWAYTTFPEKPTDMRHLCTMIKEGQGTPVIPNPFFA